MTDAVTDYSPFPKPDRVDRLKATRLRSTRYTDLRETDLEPDKLLRHAMNTADDVPDLLAELDLWREGMCQVPVDPPSLTSPRVVGDEQGVSVFHLQQTHHGIPLWMCTDGVHISLGATKPATCLGCGSDYLTEVLYPKALIDPDEPDRLIHE